MNLQPITLKRARVLVGEWHRHNKPPVGGIFAVSCVEDGAVVGVAIVGRPNARALNDGFTAEITRVSTNGARFACSMLYGACIRAAKALGYRRVYTYTLVEEPGTSVRAAGFVLDALVEARESWTCPSRPRMQENLFGEQQRPQGAKNRWIWKSGPWVDVVVEVVE